MVTIDEIKALQQRIQSSERELATYARKMEELQKRIKQDSSTLTQKSEQFHTEQTRKIEETRKIADELQRSTAV